MATNNEMITFASPNESTKITVARPKKSEWMLAKHNRFCGKTHKWVECSYNPNRSKKVAISCPSCNQYVEVLRDFGKCRKCLNGGTRRQQGFDKKTQWFPQNPARVLENDFVRLRIEYCHVCKEFVFEVSQKRPCHYCDETGVTLEKFSHKQNSISCLCGVSLLEFKKEFLPATSQEIEEGCKHNDHVRFCLFHHARRDGYCAVCKDKWAPQMPITLEREGEDDPFFDTVETVAHETEKKSWNPLKRAYHYVADDVTKRIDTSVTYAKESIEAVKQNTDTVTQEVKKVSDSMQKILKSISQFIADVPTSMPGADTIMSIAVNFMSLVKILFSSSDFSVKMAGFALFISNYVNVPSVITWCGQQVMEIYKALPVFVAWLVGAWQPQNSNESVLKVSTALVSVLVGIFLKKVPGKSDFDSILRRIDLLPKAIRGGQDILKYVTTAIKTAVSVCCDYIGKPSPFDNGLVTESDAWVTLANSILMKKLTEDTYTSKYADDVRNCYVQGLQLIRNLNTMKADFDVIRYIGSIQSQIAALNNRLAHLGFAAGPRMEPLMIYLHGTSGKGKSGLTVPFFIEMAKHDNDFDPKDWAKLIYMRCAETEYWDGARNDQPFLCYDDFAQQRDTTANPNPELFEIIRLANIVPYPAHMASLEEKGKTFLHPRCVLLTSNSKSPRIESLTFPDAFFRRMDIVAEVDVKPEFSKMKAGQNGDIRMLDVAKCSSQFDPRCYVFHVQDQGDMDWKQFMHYVKTLYSQRLSRGNKLIRELNNYTKHSLETVYSALADGTFDDLMDSDLTPEQRLENWKTQEPSMEIDPYEPRMGREAEQFEKDLKELMERYNNNQAPTEEYYDTLHAYMREMQRGVFDQEKGYDLLLERYESQLNSLLQRVAAERVVFTDGIDQSTAVGQLYILFLKKKLPAQMKPDECNEEDKMILNYFISQEQVHMNSVVFPNVVEQGLNDHDERAAKSTSYTRAVNKFKAYFAAYGSFQNPLVYVYAIWAHNWNTRTIPPAFSLSAVARAFKGMYYGHNLNKLEFKCATLVDFYCERGVAAFMDVYSPINRKATVRLARVFNQVASQCARSGCVRNPIECFKFGMDIAIRSGILIQHEVDELNQTPQIYDEIDGEILEAFRGDTFWEKFRFAWFDGAFKLLEWFAGHPTILKAITILSVFASGRFIALFVTSLTTLLGMVWGTVKNMFSSPHPVSAEGPLLNYLNVFKKSKINPKYCPYCPNDTTFSSEGLKDQYKYWFTRAGFINRFLYYSVRRTIFNAEFESRSTFDRLRRTVDGKCGEGAFHAMLHGALDEHPFFKASTFTDAECAQYNLNLEPETFTTKDAKAKQVVIESMSDKDAKAKAIKVETFSIKDAKASKVAIENLEPEGNPLASNYFEAMKQIYNDASVQPEGLLDNNAWEVISKRVYRNQFLLTTTDGAEIAKGLFLRGTCALIYKHWKSSCKIDNVQCRFLSNKPYFNFRLSDCKFADFETTRGENEDLMIMVLPMSCPQYPDLLSHFVTQQDLSRIEGRSAQLCGITDVFTGDLVSYNLQNLTVNAEDASYADNQGITYHCRKGYRYAAETKAGDCGSVLVLKDSTFDKKIIGMHVAGCAGAGFSVCVYREKILKVLKDVDWLVQCYPPLELISVVDSRVPEGAFCPLGKSPIAAGSVGTTTLRPTAIAGCCMETEKKPAHLKPFMKDGVMFDPLMEGLKKCGKVLTPLENDLIELVVDDVARVYNNATHPKRKREVFSIKEACFGRPEDEYFGSLTSSTSPGFPWSLTKEPRKAGKRTWIDFDEDFISEELIHHVEKRIEFAKEGKRYPTLWMDLLKDEARPFEKVDQGKTRVFSGSPLDFTIACRMYFGAFVAAQAEGRIDNESLVGTNCYAEDWNLVAKKLLKHGDCVVAGDYSNWDGSVSAQLLYAACDVINRWYGEDDLGNKIRIVLMMDIANSIHVIGSDVYMWTHSMPSGVYLTATVNTIIGQMLMRIFYMRAVPKQLANMGDFERNVSPVIYGDDNNVGLTQKIKPYFNQHTITAAAASIGMTYTDEQKSSDQEAVPLTRTLKEVTLLKRHFVYSQDVARWVGPLQSRTVLDIPNWYRTSMPHDVVLPLIIECVLRELSMHDKSVYYVNKAKIVEALVSNHVRVPAMPDYESLRFAMLYGYKSYFGQE